jgi:hypothetical protein
MNLVKGTIFTAQFPIFTGSFRNAKFSHDVTIKGEILKDSYGKESGQHTFTIKVLESSDLNNFQVGCYFLKKGRNLYPNIEKDTLKYPADYEFQAKEKELRKQGYKGKELKKLMTNE